MIRFFFIVIFFVFIASCGSGADSKSDGQKTNDTDTQGDTDTTTQTDNDTVFPIDNGGTPDIDVVYIDGWTTHDSLNWSEKSSNHMSWYDAKTYCANIGGRLPTIAELRTLIQNCPATQTGGECKVNDPDNLSYSADWTDACDGCGYDESVKYSVFGDREYFWSASERSDLTENAWLLASGIGGLTKLHKYCDDYRYVRCVH